MEEVQGFTRSHWTLPLGKYYVQKHKRDIPKPVFIDVFHHQHVENVCIAKGWPQLTPGGMTYQTKEKHLSNLTEYFGGGGG
jgi:hypothetical protein